MILFTDSLHSNKSLSFIFYSYRKIVIIFFKHKNMSCYWKLQLKTGSLSYARLIEGLKFSILSIINIILCAVLYHFLFTTYLHNKTTTKIA